MKIMNFYSLLECKDYVPGLGFDFSTFPEIKGHSIELAFNVETSAELDETALSKLKWVISDPYQSGQKISQKTSLKIWNPKCEFIIEVGRRLNFSTPFSSNAVSICHSIGLHQIKRIEVTTRYLINTKELQTSNQKILKLKLKHHLCDITSCFYENPITSFDHGIKPEPWFTIDVINEGRKALEKINETLGLSFDEWDLEFYTELFSKKLKRNPTSVECFDLAQSNSEHSRHWFFKGILNINGSDAPCSLFDIIKETQNFSNRNNVVKFSDNSSAIEGFAVSTIKPSKTHLPSPFYVLTTKQHLIFTAETHNFPTAICPFSGAATGTGGRIRDIQAVGRGGNTIAGTVGYSVGNLCIPGYEQPWEETNQVYSSSFASPLKILIEGSNGCSMYGNKFGEPVICGFTRTFGLRDGNKERREYLKPILFSGGVGTLYDQYTKKEKPVRGMSVIKIGGPAYRIGVGGGSASSTQVQGDNKSDLDFNAVQREDPEMEQKLNRLVRACIECEDYKNPIHSIHDQGAGGNGNVLKELVEPEGAVIFSKQFQLGDDSLSILELWGAEYQENNAILCSPNDLPLLLEIGQREHCPVNIVGTVTGNGRVILSEEDDISHEKYMSNEIPKKLHPVDLDLKLVLEDVPKKVFKLISVPLPSKSLKLPTELMLKDALSRVLRHPTVCSKRFLVNKVDRSVTGLVAQQQCVGPKHTPVADMAVIAISYFDYCGVATSIGEQPIKGLVNPEAGARMTVAEALSNLVFASISALKDIKCSGNWMWPAKLPGEGVYLYETCNAMCSIMKSLGIAIDGGKDSLSMATRLDNSEVVKSPGTLVISTYVPCPDIRKVVTPDLKTPVCGTSGVLLYINISNDQHRIGGSVLAQTYKQLGDQVPDIEEPERLKKAFEVTQKLVKEGTIMAGHDISDGGLLTCLLEMAFSGVCGLVVTLPTDISDPIKFLFSEECGWVMEINTKDESYVRESFQAVGLSVIQIAQPFGVGMDSFVIIKNDTETLLNENLSTIYQMWEETSYYLEKQQCNPECAKSEFDSLLTCCGTSYKSKILNPQPTMSNMGPRVAVLREEGLNGDREMVAALYMANFEVWDVTMQDLLDEKVALDQFKGIIFPGGFSYADVFGAAKGWSAAVLYNENIKKQFNAFVQRSDTFSFGVCNGCQLMCLIGWVGNTNSANANCLKPNVVLKENLSGRFESRFSTVKIYLSPAIMLKGMEDSTLGVWVAHGEGRFTYASPEVEKNLRNQDCLAIKYVDEKNEFTEQYPFNPNGSSGGVAGICSTDGRHLAMMPHPERCVKFWQWPYVPPKWKSEMAKSDSHQVDKSFSPWFQMFVNAYEWCIENGMDNFV